MEHIAEDLMTELECETAFTIPVFGGIDIPESVAVTWIDEEMTLFSKMIESRNER